MPEARSPGDPGRNRGLPAPAVTHSFAERGGLWVMVQAALMLAGVLAGPLGRSDWHSAAGRVAGAIAISLGAIVGIAGAIVLGRSRTVFPKPLADAVLVRCGIYRRMRHPLYTSVFLLHCGWGLVWQSPAAVLVAGLLLIFFDAKSRREEAWLRERFADYAEYQRQVRRFFPGLY